jgi:hypothetical protein
VGSTLRQTDCESSFLYATATQQPYLRSKFLSCRRSLRSYCLRPILVRTEGMPGNDEKTRIEAFASPGCSKMPRTTKRDRKNRGVPPPTVVIDQVHGAIGPESLHAMIASTAGTNCRPVVRVLPLRRARRTPRCPRRVLGLSLRVQESYKLLSQMDRPCSQIRRLVQGNVHNK